MYYAVIRTETTSYNVEPSFPAVDDTPAEESESQILSIGMNSIINDVRVRTVVVMRANTFIAKLWRKDGDVWLEYPTRFEEPALIGGITVLKGLK